MSLSSPQQACKGEDLLFLFCTMHYILLILNKYEKAIISQLRIDKLEHISHLNRQDKQVATSTAISGFGVLCPRQTLLVHS